MGNYLKAQHRMATDAIEKLLILIWFSFSGAFEFYLFCQPVRRPE